MPQLPRAVRNAVMDKYQVQNHVTLELMSLLDAFFVKWKLAMIATTQAQVIPLQPLKQSHVKNVEMEF
jgi:hypothetical protein